MASRRVNALTHGQIVTTAKTFRWDKKMPKWTVIVEGRELPVRPLVLTAAGDSTNSHMAVSILESLGFETRYNARDLFDLADHQAATLGATAARMGDAWRSGEGDCGERADRRARPRRSGLLPRSRGQGCAPGTPSVPHAERLLVRFAWAKTCLTRSSTIQYRST